MNRAGKEDTKKMKGKLPISSLLNQILTHKPKLSLSR